MAGRERTHTKRFGRSWQTVRETGESGCDAVVILGTAPCSLLSLRLGAKGLPRRNKPNPERSPLWVAVETSIGDASVPKPISVTG